MNAPLVLRPSQLIAGRIFIKKGIRYSFSDRPFMRKIFNDPGRYILLKTGRQVSKSTTMAGKAVTRMEAHAPYTVLFTAPSMDQTSKYSYDRVQPTIESSPDIKRLVGKDDIKNVYEKSFKNGSKFYLKYAKDSADNCRGISCDEWHCDEVQDVNLSKVEPVIQESMFASKYAYRMYCGTPKSFSNGIEQRLWKRSDQREWMVRCHHHGRIPYHQKMTMKNIGLKGQICDRCGNYLDVTDGFWSRHSAKTDQGKVPHIHGYHISQTMLQTSEHGGVLKWFDFMLEIENADSEDWVLNEKFGESADSAEKPISEDQLKAICDGRYKMPTEPEEWMKGRTWLAGVDWGHGLGSSTMLVIGSINPDTNKFEYCYFKRFEGRDCHPDVVIPQIDYLLRRFRVTHTHCDFGAGFELNVRLQEKGHTVTTNYWSDNVASVKMQEVHGIMRYTMNRSVEMTEFFDYIKQMRLLVRFGWTEFQPFAKDLLNIFKEERSTKHERKLPFYDHPENSMDDSAHAMIYCRLAARLIGRTAIGDRTYDPFNRSTKGHGSIGVPAHRDPFQ